MEKVEVEPSKTDYYLAQIAAEVRMGNVKSPRSVKLKQFLLKFGSAREGRDAKKRMDKSKAFWYASLGLGKPRDKGE